MPELADASVHLVVTSPPYANLKRYVEGNPEQLGHIDDYDEFLQNIERVLQECHRVLVPGGRVCAVLGDVNVARRTAGRHYVLPLSADVKVIGRRTGFDNLQGITWLKVANITLEASSSSRYLGKPNLPNGVIKNDTEHIVFLRKPGYRSPSHEMEEASFIPDAEYAKLFCTIWSDIPGASLRDHPAPFPLEVPARLIRMFSFAGDTVLDPFAGTGTTALAAMQLGRSSVSYEVEPDYIPLVVRRLQKPTLTTGEVVFERREREPDPVGTPRDDLATAVPH